MTAPLRPNLRDIVEINTEALVHQFPSLVDDPQNTLLNAIVDHLHVVAASSGSQICYTRLAGLGVFGSELFQQRHDGVQRFPVTARGDGRTTPGGLITTRNAHRDIRYAEGMQCLLTAFCVLVPLVSTVKDDVTLGEVSADIFNDLVCGTAVWNAEDEKLGGAGTTETLHERLVFLE